MNRIGYKIGIIFPLTLLLTTSSLTIGVWFLKPIMGASVVMDAAVDRFDFWSIMVYALNLYPLSLILKTPKSKYIEITHDRIIIPHILNPFIDTTTIYFRDIKDVYNVFDSYRGEYIQIVSRHKNLKIWVNFIQHNDWTSPKGSQISPFDNPDDRKIIDLIDQSDKKADRLNLLVAHIVYTLTNEIPPEIKRG